MTSIEIAHDCTLFYHRRVVYEFSSISSKLIRERTIQKIQVKEESKSSSRLLQETRRKFSTLLRDKEGESSYDSSDNSQSGMVEVPSKIVQSVIFLATVSKL